MTVTITPRPFRAVTRVPSSKSHTIRRLLVAAFARGTSTIEQPLESLDTRSCVAVCRRLGARIEEKPGGLIVEGVAGVPCGDRAEEPLDVGNSGTTLFLALALAALGERPVTFTGDSQIARRGAAPLLEALAGLGVEVTSRGGCTPITVRGPWKGGRVSLPCPTSQYLSALLLAAPLAPAGCLTDIAVPLLNERPYIEMTLAYLAAQGVRVDTDGAASRFRVAGGAGYRPLNGPVPADFSSAAFPALAAFASGGEVTLEGLDPRDTQGDKVFFDYAQEMGFTVRQEEREPGGSVITACGPRRPRGGDGESERRFDLNATPDMLPALAALAAFAEGNTVLCNAAHARIKETDRIAVMAAELGKLGANVSERPDGLVIRGGTPLRSGAVDGHGDHRVVMALAAAARGAAGPVTITGAEAADVTYPGFIDLLLRA